MKTLIYYEGKKIVKRKSVWAAFLLLLVSIAGMVYILISDQFYYRPDGSELTGTAAVTQEKAAKHALAGQLTPEVMAEALEHCHEVYGKSENYVRGADWLRDDVYIKEILPYRDILALILEAYRPNEYEVKALMDVSLQEASDFYTFRKAYVSSMLDAEACTPAEKSAVMKLDADVPEALTYDYYEGWSTLLKRAFPEVFLLTALAVCIVVSPIFASEYQTGADALILSSRYGRKQTVLAKMLAGAAATTLFYVASVAISAGTILGVMGIQGWNCDFQLLSLYSFFGLKLWQVFVIGLCINYLVVLWVMAFAMLISAVCSTAFAAVIISVLFTAAPLLLPATWSNGRIGSIIALLPAKAMDTVSAFSSYQVYSLESLVLTLPAMVILLAVALTAMMLPLTGKSFCRHQVV